MGAALGPGSPPFRRASARPKSRSRAVAFRAAGERLPEQTRPRQEKVPRVSRSSPAMGGLGPGSGAGRSRPRFRVVPAPRGVQLSPGDRPNFVSPLPASALRLWQRACSPPGEKYPRALPPPGAAPPRRRCPAATLTLAAVPRARRWSPGEADGGGHQTRAGRGAGRAVPGRTAASAGPSPGRGPAGAALPGFLASSRLLPVPALLAGQELPPPAGSARTDVSPAASYSLQPWRRGGGGGRGGGEEAGERRGRGGGREEGGGGGGGWWLPGSAEQKAQPLCLIP